MDDLYFRTSVIIKWIYLQNYFIEESPFTLLLVAAAQERASEQNYSRRNTKFKRSSTTVCLYRTIRFLPENLQSVNRHIWAQCVSLFLTTRNSVTRRRVHCKNFI